MREGWVVRDLTDVCTIYDNLREPVNSKDRNMRIAGKLQSELFPYYGATGQVGYIDNYLTEGEYVLLGEDGAPFFDYRKDTAFLINGKTWVNNHAHVLLSNFNNKFLLHYLNSFNYKDFVSGTTRLKLTQSLMRKIPVPIAPLPEQRAIVSKIEQLFSELDKGIQNLKTAQSQLKIYRQAVLKKAFEGELTKEWRAKQTDLPTADELLEQIKTERDAHQQKQLEEWKLEVKKWEDSGKEGKKPTKPRKSKELPLLTVDELEEFPVIPRKWKLVKLGNATSKIFDGPFGSNLKTADYVGFGVRIIRLENIGNLKFDNSKASYITEKKYQTIKKHTIYPHDIIFSSFIAEKTSVVSIPSDIEFAINKADCFCIRCSRLTDYKYFEFYLSTRMTYNQLINKVHGATRPRINTTQLKDLLIPFCSQEEQTQIVQEIESRLSVCDKVEESIAENLKKAEALRQSILKKAFEGKLLSQQELEACRKEEDWEPAEKLLEKIKAEKEKLAAVEKAKKKRSKKGKIKK